MERFQYDTAENIFPREMGFSVKSVPRVHRLASTHLRAQQHPAALGGVSPSHDPAHCGITDTELMQSIVPGIFSTALCNKSFLQSLPAALTHTLCDVLAAADHVSLIGSQVGSPSSSHKVGNKKFVLNFHEWFCLT